MSGWFSRGWCWFTRLSSGRGGVGLCRQLFILVKTLRLGLLRATPDLVKQLLPLSVAETTLIAGTHIAGKDSQISVECQQNCDLTSPF